MKKPNKSKKVILVGHYGVGKTSLVRRFVHEMFSDEYLSTIGVKIDKKIVELESATMTLIIWDIEGTEDQEKLPKSYFMGAHGMLFVFDLTRPETWANMQERIDYLKKLSPGLKVRIAANKSDLIPPKELPVIVEPLDPNPDFITSAKSGLNVETIFLHLAEDLL